MRRASAGWSLGLLVLWLMMVAGCDRHQATPSNKPSTIRIMLDWKPEPEFGGFYEAEISGEFSRRKLNVELKSAGEGAPTWQLVANGQADYATTAADQVIIAQQRGADVVALFAVYQTFPQGIMVHAARNFKNIEDVFTHPGVLAAEDNAWLKYLLKKYPSPAVQITGYTGGVATFLAKPDYSQQCFITSEPIEAKKKGGDPQTFLIADAGFNPYTTVLITRRKMLEDNASQVKAVVDACRLGWRKYLDDPSAANQHMHELNSEMDPQTFAAAAEAQKPLIETVETKVDGIGSMTAERWKALGQQLVDLKVVESAPPAEKCFVNFH